MPEHWTPGTPPKPLIPRPPESLWRLRQGSHLLEGQLRHHGEFGVEFQLLMDGELFFGRTYPLRECALEEAAAVRRQYEGQGWTAVPIDDQS